MPSDSQRAGWRTVRYRPYLAGYALGTEVMGCLAMAVFVLRGSLLFVPFGLIAILGYIVWEFNRGR